MEGTGGPFKTRMMIMLGLGTCRKQSPHHWANLFGWNFSQNPLKSKLLNIYDGQVSNTRVYPKVSGVAAWSENCQWCSSLPQSAVVSLFC